MEPNQEKMMGSRFPATGRRFFSLIKQGKSVAGSRLSVAS
jgi:hypothetical protein